MLALMNAAGAATARGQPSPDFYRLAAPQRVSGLTLVMLRRSFGPRGLHAAGSASQDGAGVGRGPTGSRPAGVDAAALDAHCPRLPARPFLVGGGT